MFFFFVFFFVKGEKERERERERDEIGGEGMGGKSKARQGKVWHSMASHGKGSRQSMCKRAKESNQQSRLLADRKISS